MPACSQTALRGSSQCQAKANSKHCKGGSAKWYQCCNAACSGFPPLPSCKCRKLSLRNGSVRLSTAEVLPEPLERPMEVRTGLLQRLSRQHFEFAKLPWGLCWCWNEEVLGKAASGVSVALSAPVIGMALMPLLGPQRKTDFGFGTGKADCPQKSCQRYRLHATEVRSGVALERHDRLN